MCRHRCRHRNHRHQPSERRVASLSARGDRLSGAALLRGRSRRSRMDCRRRRSRHAPKRRSAREKPVHTSTQPPADARPATSCPGRPQSSPVWPKRIHVRNRCPANNDSYGSQRTTAVVAGSTVSVERAIGFMRSRSFIVKVTGCPARAGSRMAIDRHVGIRVSACCQSSSRPAIAGGGVASRGPDRCPSGPPARWPPPPPGPPGRPGPPGPPDPPGPCAAGGRSMPVTE